MKTDGLFDFRVIDVVFDKWNEPISLYPISDIHYDSNNFARSTWEDFLCDVKKDKNKKIFILGGDTFDMFSTSERKVIDGNVHDTSYLTIQKNHIESINSFLKEVSPIMKDNTVGVFGGNHMFRFTHGGHTEHAVSAGLNAPYIGTCGFLVLRLIKRNDPTTPVIVKIFVHHGVSDAKMKKAHSHFRCDILLMGHTHQIFALPIADIGVECRGGKWSVQHHECRLIRTGSFLKSYETGSKSYPCDSLMQPSMLGCPKILITPRLKDIRIDGNYSRDRWVDIKAVV